MKHAAAGVDERVVIKVVGKSGPEFQEVFFRLEPGQLKQVVSALGRSHELDWNALYRHTGFRWERLNM